MRRFEPTIARAADAASRPACCTICAGGVEYPYLYGYDWLEGIADELAASAGDGFVVVTDEHVLDLHGDRFLDRLRGHGRTLVLTLEPSERAKSLSRLAAYLEQALEWGATRRTCVVAFGGGVVGNLAGLMSALLFRGIRLVHVPTTLVAATDSVISLKQAINSSQGKNLIGTYHRPSAVLTDLRVLETLPDREFRSGLCEFAKNCLAIRPELLDDFHDLLQRGYRDLEPADVVWLLEESIAAKCRVMSDDAHERGAAVVLEYGHTVGHALEVADLDVRGPDAISHGEAVGFGMVVAARLSERRGWLTPDDVAVHEEIVAAIGAPCRLPAHLDPRDVIDRIRTDNKRGYLALEPGTVPFVLLRALGRPAGDTARPLVATPLCDVESVVSELVADGTPSLAGAGGRP